MTDLLSQDQENQFRDAIRDVTDTFFRYPVVLRQGEVGIDLPAGVEVVTHELKPMEGYGEIDEALRVRFNRAVLDEAGLVDEDGALLIDYDDGVEVDGNAFAIAKIHDKAYFRDDRLIVVLEVVR